MKAKQAQKQEWPAIEKEGSVEVRIYRIEKKDGTVFYQVADYSTGRRTLKTFVRFPEAKQHAKAIARTMARGEAAAVELTGKDKLVYLRAKELIAPTGASLEIVAATYAKAYEILGGDHMIEAARSFSKRNSSQVIPRNVSDACTEFIDAKTSAGMSPRYLADLRHRLGRLANDFQCPISSLTGDRIQAWLNAMKLSPQSFINYFRVIGAMVAFAKRKKYVPRDWDEMDLIEKPKIRRGRVDVFTPSEIERLLGAARPAFLPALAIGAFAGLRSSEIERLDWSEVHLHDRFIEVHPIKAKTASRRIVPIVENLAEWLTPYVRADGAIWPLGHDAFYDEQMETARLAGVKWKANALRHSFISYHLAIINDAAKVSLEAGNSPAMVFEHYRELVRPEAAGQWFAVRPANGENIVVFKKQILKEAIV